MECQGHVKPNDQPIAGTVLQTEGSLVTPYRGARPIATIAQIIEVTARSFGITPGLLLRAKGRHCERYVVRYLAHKLTNETAGKIAMETGHVTRQAIMYAVRQITHELRTNEELQRRVMAIQRELEHTQRVLSEPLSPGTRNG